MEMTPKRVSDIVKYDLISIGGDLYQVEKSPITNDFGDKVLDLRSHQDMAAEILMVAKANIIMDTYSN